MIARVWTVSPLSRVSLSLHCPADCPPLSSNRASTRLYCDFCQECSFRRFHRKGWRTESVEIFVSFQTWWLACSFRRRERRGKWKKKRVMTGSCCSPPFDGDYYDVWLPADLSRRAELNEERLFRPRIQSVDIRIDRFFMREELEILWIGERQICFIWQVFLLFARALCVGKRESKARKKNTYFLDRFSFFDVKSKLSDYKNVIHLKLKFHGIRSKNELIIRESLSIVRCWKWNKSI